MILAITRPWPNTSQMGESRRQTTSVTTAKTGLRLKMGIPDLAQHFVDVYVKAEQEQRALAAVLKSRACPSSMGMNPLTSLDCNRPRQKRRRRKLQVPQGQRPKKSRRNRRLVHLPSKSYSMGVDDELMKMAQNISEDMTSGNPMGSGPSRF